MRMRRVDNVLISNIRYTKTKPTMKIIYIIFGCLLCAVVTAQPQDKTYYKIKKGNWVNTDTIEATITYAAPAGYTISPETAMKIQQKGSLEIRRFAGKEEWSNFGFMYERYETVVTAVWNEGNILPVTSFPAPKRKFAWFLPVIILLVLANFVLTKTLSKGHIWSLNDIGWYWLFSAACVVLFPMTAKLISHLCGKGISTFLVGLLSAGISISLFMLILLKISERMSDGLSEDKLSDWLKGILLPSISILLLGVALVPAVHGPGEAAISELWWIYLVGLASYAYTAYTFGSLYLRLRKRNKLALAT